MTGAWLIFEGPDGAGKTGLAAASAAVLADPRTPGGAPTVMHHLTSESTFEEYGRPHMWTRAGLNVVQDRSLLSDLVYAPVWRGVPSQLGEERVRGELLRYVGKAAMVHVTADEAVLVDRMRGRGDDRPAADPSDTQVPYLLKNYWREVGWWRDAGGTVLELDTSEGDFPSGVELEMLLSLLLIELADA